MARTSDTPGKTITTAWQLLADGVYPSAQAIRERIQQGSMTTISETLKKDFWPAVSQRLQTPSIPGPLADITEQLWRRALEVADETFSEQQEQAAERVALAEADREAARLAHQRAVEDQAQQEAALSQQLSTAEQTITTTREQVLSLTAQLAERTAALAAAETEQQHSAERSAAALAQAERRTDETEQQLTRLYDDQKDAVKRLEQQLRVQATSHAAELDTLRGELAAIQATSSAQQQQIADARVTIADQQRQIEGLNTQFKQHQALLEQRQQQMAQIQTDRGNAEQVADALREQLA